ncbi:MAG: hypothetical protein ABIP30_13215 [Ferruginibacter sp.]
MKKLLFFLPLLVFLSFVCNAQDLTEADVPVVKEIQITILDLLLKAASDYEAQRGTEILKKEDFAMYSATPENGMHASEYYITHVNKNNKQYYMSWYTDPHAQLLITTAVMTMYAYGGEKWKTVPDEVTDSMIHNTSLYCGDQKVGLLRIDLGAKAIAFTVGFYNSPTAAVAPAPTAAPVKKESMLDYGIFAPRKSSSSTAAAHDYKVYCFISTCSQGSKNFKVLSKVTADLRKHTVDEMKAEVLHRISNNGWMIQGNAEYAGLEADLHIGGKAGTDYAVSEIPLYDF